MSVLLQKNRDDRDFIIFYLIFGSYRSRTKLKHALKNNLKKKKKENFLAIRKISINITIDLLVNDLLYIL